MIRMPSSGSLDMTPIPSDGSGVPEPPDVFLRVPEDLGVHLRIVLSEQRRRPPTPRGRLRHVPEPEGDLTLADHGMLHVVIELPGFELGTAGQVSRRLDAPEGHPIP